MASRKVTINAVGFPTTIRYQFSIGNTGLRFTNLMRTVSSLLTAAPRHLQMLIPAGRLEPRNNPHQRGDKVEGVAAPATISGRRTTG